MGQPMTPHATRWLRNRALLGLAALTLIFLYIRVPALDRQNAALLTGWLLVAAVLSLVLFNLRKKLPFIPLFTAASWLQFHAYVGVLAAGVFLLHTGGRIPGGAFDRVLWSFFVLLTLSGFLGLWLSRMSPHRLRSRGEAVLFERIPIYRARLATEVEQLAAGSVKESGSLVIAELYAGRIRDFLASSGSVFEHLFECVVRSTVCVANCARSSATCPRLDAKSSPPSKSGSSSRTASTINTRSTSSSRDGCSSTFRSRTESFFSSPCISSCSMPSVGSDRHGSVANLRCGFERV